MSKTTEVTEVVTRTTDHGLSVEVTIERHVGQYAGMRPAATDVPLDIREALRAWLDRSA